MPVEFRIDLGVEKVLVRMHRNGAAQEPFIGNMHGYGVVAHYLGAKVMLVYFQGDVLADQGVPAGLDYLVALGLLDGGTFACKRSEILFQFGAQGIVGGRLGPGSYGQGKGAGKHRNPFLSTHNFTPSGIKAE